MARKQTTSSGSGGRGGGGRRSRGNTVSVDFTDVESGGGSVPDGRYVAKLLEVEQKEGQESGEPYMECTWEITSHTCQGRKIRYDNYSLQPQALWRLKAMLEALGEEVPNGSMDVDFDQIIKDGEECILEVVGKEGNSGDGRKFARVVGHFPLSDGNTVDDEPNSKSRGRGDRDERAGSRGRDRDDDRRDNDRGRRDERDSRDDDRRSRGRDDRDDDRGSRRGGGRDRDDRQEDRDDDRRAERGRGGKLKRGAEVEFNDEKNKKRTGTVEDIDRDEVTVKTDDGDEYLLGTDEVTVID